MNCKNCKFWEPNKTKIDGLSIGTCRINPPVIKFEIDRSYYGFWPDTFESDWCGKWIVKDAKTQKELEMKGL